MSPRRLMLIALPMCLLTAPSAKAGTEVLGWSLKTSTSDRSETLPINSFFNISTVTNPLHENTSSQVGLNGTTADYDYSWLMDSVFATFNTSLTQTFRTSRIREVSTGTISFRVTQDVVFSINSILNFSHTPGDEDLISWQVGMVNGATQELIFNHPFIGGGGHLLPPSGSFVIDESYTLLAGNRYNISYNLDTQNISDPAPTGIMDVSGFVNWNLTPEPSSLMLAMILIGPIAARRRRRCASGRVGRVRSVDPISRTSRRGTLPINLERRTLDWPAFRPSVEIVMRPAGSPPLRAGALRPCTDHLQPCAGILRPRAEHLRPCAEHLRPCAGATRPCAEHLRPRAGAMRPCAEHLRPCAEATHGRKTLLQVYLDVQPLRRPARMPLKTATGGNNAPCHEAQDRPHRSSGRKNGVPRSCRDTPLLVS